MKERLKDFWRDAILKNIPHGEDGSLQLNEEDAIAMTKILVKNGFAVCITGGAFGDELNVSWVYAGGDDDLNWADYEKIAFFNTDYLEDYPQAYHEEYEEEDND